ncbi:MAG: DUF2793 domain-containing protein [Porphyrobacter sp.]|nr:DUF2793 domain-containing protein [Porphyrobacter sp.]
MTDPIAFPAATPKVGLPLLFAGQSQKEFYVNQALTILDTLTWGLVEASLAEPPAAVPEGACYRVTAPATGAWSLYEDALAAWIAGAWHFVPASEGMLIFDREVAHWLCFRSGWQRAQAPAVPQGGSIIDSEARAALSELVENLQAIGILGAPPV